MQPSVSNLCKVPRLHFRGYSEDVFAKRHTTRFAQTACRSLRKNALSALRPYSEAGEPSGVFALMRYTGCHPELVEGSHVTLSLRYVYSNSPPSPKEGWHEVTGW